MVLSLSKKDGGKSSSGFTSTSFSDSSDIAVDSSDIFLIKALVTIEVYLLNSGVDRSFITESSISSKLVAAEELMEQRRTEFSNEIKELHSRITTNTKELLAEGTRQHKEHAEAIQKLHNDINKRVGVLEKWRWVLIGGSIVIGFVLHKMIDFT